MKFKRETEFQETEIGKIPREWKVVYLSELFEFHRGLSYRKNNLSPTQTSIRFVTINDLKKEGGWKREGESAYLSEEFKDKIEKKHILKVGDLLIAITDMSKGFIIGAPLYINEDIRSQGETLVYSMDLIKLQPKKQVNTLFYFYQLSWSKIREIMKSLARGTNVLHLDLNLAQRIKLVEPPLNEQVRIAEILSTVDRAIEVVDAGVARLEGLKKALIRELLTGRIRVREENGKTAFYRETEFQDTEIGKIPKDWKAVKLKEIVEPRKEIVEPNQVEPFTPYVGLEHVESGEVKLKRFGKAKDVKSTKLKFYKKDILYGKLRPYLDKAVISDINGVCSTDFIVMKTIYNVLPEYLIWILHSERFIRYSIQSMRGTNHPRTSWESLANFIVHLPPMIEQKAIANILFAVERLIELYDEEKARLERLKKKLMDLLLTGRVRVMEE